MRLEITVNRIGGEEGPRHFTLTDNVQASNGTIQYMILQCTDSPAWFMRLTLRDLVPAEEGFSSCLATLETADGMPIAHRPVLIYDRPCDVPIWSTFQRAGLVDLGVFSVGFRRVL